MDKSCSNETHGTGDFAKKGEMLKRDKKHKSPESFSPVDVSRAIEEAISTSASTLDLSRKKIHHLKEEILQVPNIKHLHLQGNSLSRVPDDFFQQFTNLVWLDLRYNRLTSLPSGIGAHRNLKSLLLEGNPIKALPVELGNLTTLKALNLRHCPLEFPPIEIVQKGLQNILLFLQNARVGKCNQVEPSLPDEWPNEQEMKLFQSLKHRIMQSEKDECIQGLPYSIPGGQAEDSSSKIKDTKRISALSARKKSNLTDPSMYDVKIQNRRAEERKKTALTELKEKQAFLEQRKRDQEILNEWRKEAKIMQEKKEMKEKTSRFPPAIGDQVPISAPYATDHDRSHTKDSLENKKVHGSKQQERIRRVSLKSLKEFEQERTSRDIELDHRIKQHIQTMQEKRKQPALNEMRQAKEDLKTAERLQNELLQLKEEAPLEYRFTAFTGEISPTTTPRGQPQNIFSTTQFF
ncbi:leucine-rich repeat-containing protein 27 isoform X5 [Pleurodeles waltl]|uniref:leucine-rich repeat-containing protein 27 isoform X5 n=1 Tax=Pleurodeles waltl TaxID=8319 RepID=UPI0037095A67